MCLMFCGSEVTSRRSGETLRQVQKPQIDCAASFSQTSSTSEQDIGRCLVLVESAAGPGAGGSCGPPRVVFVDFILLYCPPSRRLSPQSSERKREGSLFFTCPPQYVWEVSDTFR